MNQSLSAGPVFLAAGQKESEKNRLTPFCSGHPPAYVGRLWKTSGKPLKYMNKICREQKLKTAIPTGKFGDISRPRRQRKSGSLAEARL